ncbi:metallophosphoesterase [Urbifossiella limnaea]|uniref:Calcineurin-like phosphoesterase n=1 Tax=Urbifossiella limnaea TaxID=2528023 RepID=A0A517XYB1_9BACT|nr:metallophosphoesterase [Urbifossiella limnaea]QDU22507.1 Calcineurin-like phosphoesterase [Urbifossiella limnaea]
MPAPDRMLTFLRQAIVLARATPGRRGRMIEPVGCTEVLVAGDLHGHVGHFQGLLKAADLANHAGRHLVFQELIHGNYRYPSGGDKSHQLVDLFAALKAQFPRQVHYLPGNHELAQWTGRKVLKADADLNAAFEQGATAAYGPEFGPQVYQTYLDLFKALPVALRTPNRVLVSHSLPSARQMSQFDPLRLLAAEYTDADLQPGGSVHGVLWGRDVTPANVADYLRRMAADFLVSGHIASDTGYSVPNDMQLIVDCAESPAGYALFPADRPLTHEELVASVRFL